MNELDKPMVSIVVTCFNYGEYLNAAIYSCLKSTYKEIEIIVVNDGSTDAATIRILDKIKHPKVRVINKENKGLPAARNTGIREAKGKYILPVDADDLIGSTLIEKEVNVMERDSNIHVVTHWTRAFGTEDWIWRPEPFKKVVLLQENIVCGTSLFRKAAWEAVGGYNEKMNQGYEDWDFWISLIEAGFMIYTIPEILFYYRRHGETMSYDSDKKRQYLVNMIRNNHKELYEEYGV